MSATSLAESYCICVDEDGAPREIDRRGAVLTYKAMGYESGQPVALQLIPTTNIDENARARFEETARAVQKLQHPNIAKVLDVRVEDEHIVFATEYLEGETAEAWVVRHGPMPVDAVLRVAVQVVSALTEAAFRSLTHRGIQPSNLMIVPGVAPDGGWPLTKLLNFGLAGVKLYAEQTQEREIAPSLQPAFASPEELEKGVLDFRSEVFSLGATMCFLLTGAVPLAARGAAGERALPRASSIPKAVRHLLRRMLQHDPGERPQDPIALADELRKLLARAGRRTQAAPIAAPLESSPSERSGPDLLTVLLPATLVVAFLVMAGLFVAQQFGWFSSSERPLETIGVPVGIAEESKKNARTTGPEPANAPSAEPTSNVAESSARATAPASPVPEASAIAQGAPALSSNSSPGPTQSAPAGEPLTARATAASVPESSTPPVELAARNRMTEPLPPAEGPPPPPENIAQPSPPQPAETPSAYPPAGGTTAASSAAEQQPTQKQPESPAPPESRASPPPPKRTSSVAKETASMSKGSKKTATRRKHVNAAERARSLPPMQVGTMHAEFAGTTSDGKWILRLPNGNTVVTPPVPDTTREPPVIRNRRVRRVEPASQPQAPPADQLPPVIVLPPEQ